MIGDFEYIDGEREVFVDALGDQDTGAAIMRQEARGQETFVQQETLPIEGLKEFQAPLETLGFKFGEPVDDLFISVEFPEGWTKQATSHSMWSYLIDPQGRERGSLFYKAAFYDRGAHIDLNTRFGVTENYDRPAEEEPQVMLADNMKQVTKVFGSYDRTDPYASRVAREKAKVWMNENLPDWENVLAYWDEDITIQA